MARHTPLTSVKPISEINLTPLMDLTFILLITFIITFPLIEQGIPVNLPSGQAAPLTQEQSRRITVDREGALYLDQAGVSATELALRLVEIREAAPATAFLIRADESIAYGQVIEVLKLLRAAGITRMALVTQAE